MKLYYFPGACSLAAHIILREAGLDFELVKTDIQTGKLEDGSDFKAVNPLGYVPVLITADNQKLTENAAILQYLGDRNPDSHLCAPGGTMAHYRQIEWLNFIATELHKTMGPFFSPEADEAQKQAAQERLAPRLAHVEAALAHRDYLTGHVFTVVDAYLFVMELWLKYLKLDTMAYPKLVSHMQRVAMRDAVREAVQAEGLAGLFS